MRIVLVSRFAVIGAYQRWLEALAAALRQELVVIAPPYWRREDGSIQSLMDRHTNGYRLLITPARHNGNAARHYYPWLRWLLAEVRPNLLHLDSSPEQAATTRGIRLATRAGIPVIFHATHALTRHPTPASWWRERYTYTYASGAIADSAATLATLRHRGWHGPAIVIPIPGADPATWETLAQQMDAFYRERLTNPGSS